jgi:guanine nucleotide-binding protein subunit alpha
MFTRDWIPDNQDILLAHVTTTGVTETSFEIGHLNLRMVDVSGARSEQRKWVYCFDGVQCLIFVVALSGYDQCLAEDPDRVYFMRGYYDSRSADNQLESNA